MKVFAKIHVLVPAGSEEAYADKVDSALNASKRWRRRHDREQWLADRGGAPLRCYERVPIDALPGALVWIDASGGGVRVTNITPLSPGALSVEDYNAIVGELHAAMLPCAKAVSGAQVIYDDGEDVFRGRLSPAAMLVLDAFASAANPAEAAAHPLDRERWTKVILSAHREGATLDGALLARWLREERGFGYDAAEALGAEYEHARELLRAYDQAAA